MGNLKDFATSTVLTPPSPATSGTSIVVQTGHGARFPAVPFFVVAHPPSEFPTLDNAEKLEVTAKTDDTFTVLRAQGSTTAKTIESGWRISNAVFLDNIPDTFDDLADGTTNKAYTGTEKTKLAGVETGAEVTSTAKVDAAGATMNTDTNVKTNSWVLDQDNMSGNDDTKVPTQQSVKAYVDAAIAALGTVIAQTGDIFQQAGVTIPSGWLACDGTAVSRTTYAALFAELVKSKGTFTVTVASPGVVTNTSHGIYTGEGVYLTTTGALPTGLTANTMYYAIRVDANTFRLAPSRANAEAGTAINTSGTQSGTHTLWYCPWGNGDGTTTFNTPDLRDRTLVGKNTSGTFQALGKRDGAETHTLTQAQLPSVSGTFANSVPGGHGNYVSGNFSSTGSWAAGNFPFAGGSSTTTPWGYTFSFGSNQAHNNLQPYAVINYRIKT